MWFFNTGSAKVSEDYARELKRDIDLLVEMIGYKPLEGVVPPISISGGLAIPLTFWLATKEVIKDLGAYSGNPFYREHNSFHINIYAQKLAGLERRLSTREVGGRYALHTSEGQHVEAEEVIAKEIGPIKLVREDAKTDSGYIDRLNNINIYPYKIKVKSNENEEAVPWFRNRFAREHRTFSADEVLVNFFGLPKLKADYSTYLGEVHKSNSKGIGIVGLRWLKLLKEIKNQDIDKHDIDLINKYLKAMEKHEQTQENKPYSANALVEFLTEYSRIQLAREERTKKAKEESMKK